MLLCLLAQTEPILFAHTQSDIETDGWSTMSVCLSVCPPSAVDFSTGSNESEKNHCCNGDDGRARVSPALQTLLVRNSGFLFTHVGKMYSSKKLGKYQGATILRSKLSPARPPWPPGGSGWPSAACSHFWLQVDSSDVIDTRVVCQVL